MSRDGVILGLTLMAALPEPTAQGDLARTPFAHALLHCQQRGLSGTLVIWPEDPETTRGQDRIRFEGGVAVAARFVTRSGALDRGMLPLFSRRAGAYAFYSDLDLVGEDESVRTGRVDAFTLLAASLRGPSRDDAVDSVLEGLRGAPLRIRPGADLRRFELLPKEEAFIEVLRAAPARIDELVDQCELGERAGLRLLYLLAVTKSVEPWDEENAPKSSPGSGIPASLLGGRPKSTPGTAIPASFLTGVPRSSAGTVVPAELRSEEPDLPLPSEPPPPISPAVSQPPRASSRSSGRLPRPSLVAEPEPPPPPPPHLSHELTAQWNEIAVRARAIDTENYFDMLGIPRDANSDAVRKAYFAAVKKWHPDRVPAELAPIKPWVDRIFQLLTTANETLSDESKRGKYQGVVADGGGTPASERQLAAIVQGAMEHQKAEVLIRRRDVDGAIAILEEALALSPEDGDIHATYAWALFQSPTGDRQRMMSAIHRALELNPRSDKAHYYHGLIQRRLGQEAQAIASFEKAVELNKKNVEAMREVRLAKMRSSTAIPAAGGGEGGLLSRLFGGKKEK